MSIALMLLATAASQCATIDQAVPAPLQQWTRAGADSRTKVELGKASTLVLQGKAGDKFDNSFPIRIAKAGRYGVAINQPAWIDLERDGKALSSPAHQHGPGCTSIRKIVLFELVPGTYSLRLSKSPVKSVKTLIIRWPE